MIQEMIVRRTRWISQYPERFHLFMCGVALGMTLTVTVVCLVQNVAHGTH
jgi:hypothetical protein